MNPMLANLNRNNAAQARNMLSMLNAAGNPQMLLQQMMTQNPMLAQVMQTVRQYGGDPQKAFYDKAREAGIDPNVILNQLR